MQLNPYLSFNGQCETAFKFYERSLGGKIMFKMTYGESPMAEQVPPKSRGRILHITLKVGDRILMGADAPPQYYSTPAGFSVSINTADIAEAERVFAALSENAVVKMPLGETFWAARFGMLVDQFGTPWMVNCEKKA